MARLLVAILVGILCTVLSGSVRAQSDLPTIHIGGGLDDETKPLLYAQSAGLFEKAGLHVVVDKLGSGSVVAAAVAGGSLEIGKASVFAIIAAHARGLPFTIIAPVAEYRSEHPFGALLLPVNSTAKSAKDLNGKTFGVTTLQDMNMIATEAWIDANGGDSSTLKFVELPPPAIPAAIDSGRIDGAAVFEPAFTNGLATGKAKMGFPVYDAFAKRFQGAVLFANSDWVAKHRETAEKVARVMIEANAYVAAHETETIPLIANFVGMDVATLTKMRHPDRPLRVDPGAIQPLIDVCARYHVIKAVFPAQELISDIALKATK